MATTTLPVPNEFDPWGVATGPIQAVAVCVFCRGAGEVAVGQDPDGAELMAECRRCGGSGAPADTERGAA